MKYSNVVRFRVKKDHLDDVIQIFSQDRNLDGLLQNILIKTGETTMCSIGIWESEEKIAAARPKMIEWLNMARDMLEEISTDLGVTDPVSGPVIFEL
tara:strand:- start:202 stop:492 length:291 start_codon:yes stop_codon:yes gene_type:complete